MRIYHYIGRFQPFHNGHLAVVKRALQECDRLHIIIGSADAARSLKNPFTAFEREFAITQCLVDEAPDMSKKVVFSYVEDYADDQDWVNCIKSL